MHVSQKWWFCSRIKIRRYLNMTLGRKVVRKNGKKCPVFLSRFSIFKKSRVSLVDSAFKKWRVFLQSGYGISVVLAFTVKSKSDGKKVHKTEHFFATFLVYKPPSDRMSCPNSVDFDVTPTPCFASIVGRFSR